MTSIILQSTSAVRRVRRGQNLLLSAKQRTYNACTLCILMSCKDQESDQFIVSSPHSRLQHSGWEYGSEVPIQGKREARKTQNLHGREGAIHISKQYLKPQWEWQQ